MSLKKFKNFLEKNTTYKKIFIIIVIFLAIISVARAVQQAQIYSYDFSVSTAKLVSEGINNYEYVLQGKHDRSENDKLLYSQDGLYAHGFHVILIPFTNFFYAGILFGIFIFPVGLTIYKSSLFLSLIILIF